MRAKQKRTYISLFSSAGIGCYGFKQAGFDCVATNELIPRRLQIQKYNNKCKYGSGYIDGDIEQESVKQKIFDELELWRQKEKIKDLDVLIATPPCQGMSVANHKKKNENKRNSLIIQSIIIVKEINPKYFIFENVKTFLSTICTDINGTEMTISEAIDFNLGGQYNILKKIINFKDYGSNSSRTRTVVIGVRKDINDITPYDLFPKLKAEKTLKEVIGKFEPLEKMGDISPNDIYHQFKPYASHMLEWIKDIKEGETAFDNKDASKMPHQIIDGVVVPNKNKNGDKYKRCEWSKVAPCIHTRNDILASQATIHPCDNRVMSIRELMELMTIPVNFNWTDIPYDKLNKFSLSEKRRFLKQNEINIRQSIGEAVPTVIFNQIATNIILNEEARLDTIKIKNEITRNKLDNVVNLKKYIQEQKILSASAFKVAELSNSKRTQTSAYYTRRDICFSLINDLPDFKNKKTLNILEPSVGIGNFIFLLLEKYSEIENLNIDIIDIDNNSLEIFKILLSKIDLPKNVSINFINEDFLTYKLEKKYDLIVGNPPFGKVSDKNKLAIYKKDLYNTKTSNIFSFFIEKALKHADFIAFVTPKSLLSAPEFNLTRALMSEYNFNFIQDYGENAFNGVKIETISFMLQTKNKAADNNVKIVSYITKNIEKKLQDKIFDKDIPTWLLYRNEFFEKIKNKMTLGVFEAYRDRQITKAHTKNKGKVRVLKARNIQTNQIVDVKNYDSFMDDIEAFATKKHLNNTESVLVPNLSYYPRACFKPKNTIVDGSVAILTPKNGYKITKKHLEYYSSDEFTEFYKIARNYGTRSLNIDSNAVYFWGLKKEL